MDYATGYNIIWFIFRNKTAELVAGILLLLLGMVGLIKRDYFYNLLSEILLKYRKINLKEHLRIQFFVGALYLIIIWGLVLIFNVLGWLDTLNDFVASKVW